MDAQKLTKIMEDQVNTAPLLANGQTGLLSIDGVILENELSQPEKRHLTKLAKLLMNNALLAPYVYGVNANGLVDWKTATGFSFDISNAALIKRVFGTYGCPSCKECSFIVVDFQNPLSGPNKQRFSGFIELECQSCKYLHTDIINVPNTLNNYLTGRVRVC